MANGDLKYGKSKNSIPACRTVVVMPSTELEDIDRWGVPAGMPSRTAAIRYLLKQGLEAVRANENQRVAG